VIFLQIYGALRAIVLEPSISNTQGTQVLELSWADRWQVYRRLQELGIPSWCEANAPLRVEISNPLALLQLWGVLRQLTASRQEMIGILEGCWRNRV
jgi:hypothetical protein